MQLVLLSGGSGQRLWPLSNDVRSKQFIQLLTNEDGQYESMVQRVFRQINEAHLDTDITIATSKSQVSSIVNQVGSGTGISIEPYRRDTFPAIALAAAYLHDVKAVSDDEPIVICPVDPYVDNSYFSALKELSNEAMKDDRNLTLMGIEPTYPSEKYGYILPESQEHISSVSMFKEKPDTANAIKYISHGALWNGGIFAFQLGYMLERAHSLLEFSDYHDLFNNYDNLPKISFDYAVVEHEPHIKVMRYAGQWKDLGTWNTLTDAMEKPVYGKAVVDSSCKNVRVINDLDVPIMTVGISNMIISASPEGILVADRDGSTRIKPLVNQISQQIMFAEKSWGSYRVLDVSDGGMTVKVTLNPGHHMNYHSHLHRDEVWTVLSGKGWTVVDGSVRAVHSGDVIELPAGSRHSIIADSELRVIEVQSGHGISVSDKRKYDYDFDKLEEK